MEIVEVGPRDGLQNEAVVLPTAAKVELIRRAVAAGVRRIEVTSFVNPKRVPQMADAEDVVAALDLPDEVSTIGLVLNERGLERAVDAGVREVNFVVVATDEFSRRNSGVETAVAIGAWERIPRMARDAGIVPTVTIAAAFGCPFSGEVPVSRVAVIAAAVAADGPAEICLADTIGVAVPADVRERVSVVRGVVGDIALRCHFHDTRSTGIANALAAAEVGVGALDASLGGIGGCPFAPAATGNIATEDLVYALERSGVKTGLDLDALCAGASWLEGQLGRRVPGMLAKAGGFPQSAHG